MLHYCKHFINIIRTIYEQLHKQNFTNKRVSDGALFYYIIHVKIKELLNVAKNSTDFYYFRPSFGSFQYYQVLWTTLSC